jgi:hypothetical protein
MAQEAAAQLRLRFANGTERSVDVRDAAAVLRGYAVPAPAFRSRRVFDMAAEYAEKHRAHRRREALDPDIDGWDRRFIARVDDTDLLHDLFLDRFSESPPVPSFRYCFVPESVLFGLSVASDRSIDRMVSC